jgi:hypothetical protein
MENPPKDLTLKLEIMMFGKILKNLQHQLQAQKTEGRNILANLYSLLCLLQ